MAQVNRIVWLDLETTGLDPFNDQILEVGVIVTDEKLVELARARWILRCDAMTLGSMNPKVVAMHANSGLWAECLESTYNTTMVRRDLLEFLSKHGCKGAYLAGNSVGDFDRHFLRRWMPDVNEYLSHRSINSSTFKALFSMWAPEVKPPTPQKGPAHRSLADCEYSISELKFWLAHDLMSRAVREKVI